jgi:hypothetical protein
MELGGQQDHLRLLFLSQMYTTLVQTLESQLHFHHHPKLFADFFRQNDDRPPIASSTAASVASSVSEPDVEDLPPHPPQPPSNSIKNDDSERIDLNYYPQQQQPIQ